ncbi:MAG: DNA mismatch repair protein MutS [Dehalococcoidia bacterium]
MTAPLTLAATPACSEVPAAAEFYRTRQRRYQAERESSTRHWSLVANARLVFFAVALVVAGFGVLQQSAPILAATLLPLAAFFALIVGHNRLDRRRRRLILLETINSEAERRVLRQWDNLPVHHQTRPSASHGYAADLDLFGRASIFHLLDAAGDTPAEEVLAGWLTAPDPPHAARTRQAAIRELAPLAEFREQIQMLARLAAAGHPDPAPLLAWAEGPGWLAGKQNLLWVGRIAVAALWLAILGQVFGLLAWPIWLLPLGLTLLIASTAGRDAYRLVASVRDNAEPLRWYAESFRVIAEQPLESPALVALTERLIVEGAPVQVEIARLYQIGNFAIPRSSMLYAVVQALTLWDLNVAAWLDTWQQRCGRQLRDWLRALAEIEALSTLAVLAHDNPDWSFPTIADQGEMISGGAVGHPLLPAGERVDNTVTLGPAGTFLLVTGSNMSGKSTYLRAIGTNVVLALAGAPVCARSFSLPLVEVWTSMRVQDSLEAGVSFFMAELRRIKQVVDAADRAAARGGRVLYLLDEILLGTNTAERQTAARHIIAHLVGSGALGAVSTHDLSLASAPELAGAAERVHFSERIEPGPDGAVMSFDYRLQPGLATSTNALRLMRVVGLPTEDVE